MAKYIHSFFILSLTITLPFSFLIFLATINNKSKMVIMYIAIMVIYCSIYFLLKKKQKIFFWISFIPITALWIILLLQEARRIIYIVENGGMDPATQSGSPMAFLIGMFFELMFFIPLSYALISGIVYLIKERKS